MAEFRNLLDKVLLRPETAFTETQISQLLQADDSVAKMRELFFKAVQFDLVN